MSSLIGSPGIQLPNSPSGTVFVSDACIDTDGTPLENHIIAPDNLNDYSWEKGNIKSRFIYNNKIAMPDLADPDGKENDYFINIGERFLTVKAKAETTSTGSNQFVTLIVRFVDINNYIGIRWSQFDPIVSSVEIVKSVDGSASAIGVVLANANAYFGTEQTMELIDDGDNVTGVFADETPVQVATSLFNFTPKIGIKNTFDPLATIRDVEISKT